jgi:hypothetical protein
MLVAKIRFTQKHGATSQKTWMSHECTNRGREGVHTNTIGTWPTKLPLTFTSWACLNISHLNGESFSSVLFNVVIDMSLHLTDHTSQFTRMEFNEMYYGNCLIGLKCYRLFSETWSKLNHLLYMITLQWVPQRAGMVFVTL